MSQKKIKVSIIVPVFNEEDYIEKCVNEIKQILLKYNTTYEIIVSDNNSNDNTRNILKKFNLVIKISLHSFVKEINDTWKLSAIQIYRKSKLAN